MWININRAEFYFVLFFVDNIHKIFLSLLTILKLCDSIRMMEEKVLLKGFMPIIKNLAKQRFLYQLELTRCILISNNNGIDLYEAYEREERIKIRLAKNQKIKNKDLETKAFMSIKSRFAKFIASEHEDNRRYDFLIELMLISNKNVFHVEDIYNILTNPTGVYEEYFKEKFEEEEIEHLLKRANYLI